jgi:hypothetical protein
VKKKKAKIIKKKKKEGEYLDFTPSSTLPEEIYEGKKARRQEGNPLFKPLKGLVKWFQKKKN